MDVLDMLIKRAEYGFDPREKDLWLDEELRSRKKEIAIITTENSLRRINGPNKENLVFLFETYKTKGMFSLTNPYSNTNVEVFLYIFEKKWNKDILYGIYKNKLRRKPGRGEGLILAEEFPEEYFDYLDKVEKYVETGECPVDSEVQEFGIIDKKTKEEDHWNPNRYNKISKKIKEALRKEQTVKLSEVASIIRPRPDEKRRHINTCFSAQAWKYPLDYDKLREGVLTDSPLQKGDIVFIDKDRLYLLYDKPKEELHISPNFHIIRPKSISPEYLYLYLKSDTAQVVMESVSMGIGIRRITRRDMESIPVILPRKDNSYYEKTFIAENFPIESIEQFNRVILQFPEKDGEANVEDLLDEELVGKLKTYKADVMESFLSEDLRELNVCFRNKAYKATLILAGSILEAVLIDWLSEIHRKNYFEEEYYSRKDGKPGTLAIYIRDIKYIKRPNWMEEAEKAYIIKDNRNMVHAKLCINREVINEDLCREVVGYLEDVLKTRRGKTVKRV